MLSRRLIWPALTVGLVLLVAPPAASPAAGAEACQPAATRHLSQRPWPQDRLQFQRVWPITRGAGQIVAVTDTGVDAAHPQLRGHVTAGHDVLTGEADADTDCQGHGTFVAGIIAAQPAAGVGFVGVAPDATILPIRETTSEQVDPQALAMAVMAATQIRPAPTIINISTTTDVDFPELRAAVQAALRADIVVIASAGNDAQQGNAAKYPAVYPGVLSVGAIDSSGARSQFSETVGVGVVAPGQDLISTGAGGDGLVSGEGTSYAAAYVSGVAALVRAYHPLLSAAQVVQRIELTADHPAGTLPSGDFGWGVVDPYTAVTAILPAEGERALARPAPSPVPLAAPPVHSDHRGATVAYLAAAAAVLLVVLVAALAVVIPAGHRRGWRPAGRDRVAPAGAPPSGPASAPTG